MSKKRSIKPKMNYYYKEVEALMQTRPYIVKNGMRYDPRKLVAEMPRTTLEEFVRSWAEEQGNINLVD